MIIEALNRYYHILANDPNTEIAPLAFSKKKVKYAIQLNKEGELINIIPLIKEVIKGKKAYLEAMTYILPQEVIRKSGSKANFLWDKSSYFLGIDDKAKKDKTQKDYYAFKTLHLELLKDIDNPIAKSIIAFLNHWNPEMIENNEKFTPYLDDIYKNNLCFMVDGNFAHEDEQLKNKWLENQHEKLDKKINLLPCAITGILSPIAKVHPGIKNVKGKGAQSGGAAIVTYNLNAFEYGSKKQGANAQISEDVAFAYTTALNYLTSSEKQKIIIGDTTVVFWAESSSSSYYDIINALFSNPNIDKESDVQNKELENDIFTYLKNALQGIPSNIKSIDDSTKFYILGLSPNIGRISIRFFYFNTFSTIVKNISKHYQAMKLVKEFSSDFDYIPIWKMLTETVSPKSKDKEPVPILAGEVMRSIIEGKNLPISLYYSILNRIKINREINYAKVSIIKAYLTRRIKMKNKKEEFTVSLNHESTSVAYLLGRLFALLEKAQYDAMGKTNASIKDRYFSSACSTPASVFPTLLKLAQSHLAKVKWVKLDKLIQDVINKINDVSLPKYLSLEEQGIFILGYYHQRVDLFKNNENNKGEMNNENN